MSNDVKPILLSHKHGHSQVFLFGVEHNSQQVFLFVSLFVMLHQCGVMSLLVSFLDVHSAGHVCVTVLTLLLHHCTGCLCMLSSYSNPDQGFLGTG